MDEPTSAARGLDSLCALLENARRRYLLYQLQENGTANVEELSLQIAAWERDESVATVDETARERVAISLVHDHLPRLADHGVVEYDPRSGDVVTSDGLADIEQFLEEWRGMENALERPSKPARPSGIERESSSADGTPLE